MLINLQGLRFLQGMLEAEIKRNKFEFYGNSNYNPQEIATDILNDVKATLRAEEKLGGVK